MKSMLAAAALAVVLGLGQGQTRQEFDVAVVRPVDVSKLGNAISINIGSVRHEEVTFGNVTLNDCIRFAYRIGSDVQIEGPNWIKSNQSQFRYDIVAKGAPGTSREQLQDMMQTLLDERFMLKVHREQKEMSYYALVLDKNGPKIRFVTDVPEGFRGTTFGGRINSILQMPMLSYLLSRFETGRPIIDETGLRGMYEVKLEWAPSQQQNADTSSAPSLFTAVSEQLGLKLEGRKGPVEILVVDSAEKVPTDN